MENWENNEEMRQKAKNVFNRIGNREEKYYDKIAMMNLQKTKTWTCTTRSVDDQSQFYKENCEDMKEFFKILNSAPANLRYGCSTVNRGISDATDPMGMDPFHPSCKNCNTEKEKRWMTGMLVPNAKNLMIVLPSQCSHPNKKGDTATRDSKVSSKICRSSSSSGRVFKDKNDNFFLN